MNTSKQKPAGFLQPMVPNAKSLTMTYLGPLPKSSKNIYFDGYRQYHEVWQKYWMHKQQLNLFWQKYRQSILLLSHWNNYTKSWGWHIKLLLCIDHKVSVWEKDITLHLLICYVLMLIRIKLIVCEFGDVSI